MIPEKGKCYYIDYPGFHGYDAFHGKALCIDDVPTVDDGWYKFKLPKQDEAFFEPECIITEMTLVVAQP